MLMLDILFFQRSRLPAYDIKRYLRMFLRSLTVARSFVLLFVNSFWYMCPNSILVDIFELNIKAP